MSTTSSSTDGQDQPSSGGSKFSVGTVFTALRRSLLLSTAAFGIVMIALGATVLKGVFAALFGIWGAMLIGMAAVGILGIRIVRYI